MDILAFALSAGLAQIFTNIDNLAALLGLSLVMGPWRSILAYMLAQGLILTAAMGVALGANQVQFGSAGLLGLIPLFLGMRGVWQQFGSAENSAEQGFSGRTSLVMTTVLFLSLSLDSFAVMTPLLVESSPVYRGAALMGALMAVVLLGAIGLVFTKTARPTGSWISKFERLAPYVMICAGLYVLLDSGTDGL
ncbi:cadmium resistance transporter [Phaeobacter sp. NW0010-22]|uniref:cadmium resistance transporter n=1 Tax=Phaeobacter sp. NW0010-22 TaxID=3135907 RepID=UPI003109330D